MFGKKKAPQAPWSVEVLTNDYLVAGQMDGDDPTGPWFLRVQAAEMAMATLTLRNVTFQPTGNHNTAPAPAARWVLPSTGVFMAVIPRDEASRAHCLSSNGSTKNPYPGLVLVGPYVLRGTILSPDSDLDILAGYQTFAMQDVTIDAVASGALLKGLAAPYVIVRTLLLQGIVLGN